MTSPTDRLKEIEARLEKATPGPWHNYYPNAESKHSTPNDVFAGKELIACSLENENANFIANAPEDIRWLLDEVKNGFKAWQAADKERDALAAKNKRLREALEKIVGWTSCGRQDLRTFYVAVKALEQP